MTYEEFKQQLLTDCDEMLQDAEISDEDKKKVAWLRSRIIIEM